MNTLKQLLAPLLCAAWIGGGFAGVQAAEEPQIHIPQGSAMQFIGQDENLTRFSGEVRLLGQLLLVSEYRATDYDEGQVPIDFEWFVSLSFLPDAGQRSKLPHVRYPNEPQQRQGEPWIELDYWKKEQLIQSVKRIFGNEVAESLGKKDFKSGKRGYLRLKSYVTAVECDHRYHYAETVEFDSEGDITPAQVQQLLAQISGCGGLGGSFAYR